jgi:hypothetical protein
MPHLKRIIEENKKGNSLKDCLQTYSVHRARDGSKFWADGLKSMFDYQ